MAILNYEEQKLLEEALRHRPTSAVVPTENLSSPVPNNTASLQQSGVSEDDQTPNDTPPSSPVQQQSADVALPSASSLVFQSEVGGDKKYFTLEEAFPNAAVFLMFFDYSLKTGAKQLYPWQIEELLRLSNRSEWRTDNQFLYYLLANNGSGKDAFIIAGFVCYVLCCWRRYKIVITSSSDNQLDTQTRVYIKDLAESVNAYMRSHWEWEANAIEIKAESFRATKGFSGTEVYTFVSKEGAKVEGYHPFPDADPGEGCIVIINEAKSIPPEIHQHLQKCTYNYWIEVSSAGESAGTFYKAVTNAIYYPQKPKAFRPFCRVVTYKDTPHKQRKAEEDIKECGEDDPFVKNTYLSKFSSLGAQVAITEESLDKCIRTCTQKIVIGAGRHAGLDFAAGGGDWCSFTVFDENELVEIVKWRVRDTEITIDILLGDGISLGMFQKYGFTKETAENITGDDNGLGEPIINALHRRGWRIGRVKNQGSALRKDRYLNRGAELYGSFSRMVAGCYINFNGKLSVKAKTQLQTRHYDIQGQAKFKLWPKEEESESPDDADSIVLAWCKWSVLDFMDDKVKKTDAIVRTPAPLIPHKGLLASQISREAISRYAFEGMKFENTATIKFKRNTPITVLRSLYARS